jgi:preprotein translocase subunit SecE
VRSDLRNTGILVVIMTGLLAAAVVIVNLVGSAPQ